MQELQASQGLSVAMTELRIKVIYLTWRLSLFLYVVRISAEMKLTFPVMGHRSHDSSEKQAQKGKSWAHRSIELFIGQV